MESAIEPALDSFAGNIEIAIYMANELENALYEIYQKTNKCIGKTVEQPQTMQQGCRAF
jgi:hypothetical protein